MGYWCLKAALYQLREGAWNWYNRFKHHSLSLGFEQLPPDPASLSYKEREVNGCQALHVDDSLTAGKARFDKEIIVPLLSRFCISKVEKGSFRFLVMKVKQGDNLSIKLSQDSKSIHYLPEDIRKHSIDSWKARCYT